MRRVRRAAGRIRDEGGPRPAWGVILGTGLGALGEEIAVEVDLPYGEIPGFAPATVDGREGRLLLGAVDGRPLVAMSGRYHPYAGHPLEQVALPVRVMRELGAEAMVLSGAAGGLDPRWERGDLALISDHVNCTGDNPLVGPNVEAQGPRFPDMSEAYDGGLRERARRAALEHGLRLREGVYAGVTGPDRGTPAEHRMLRTLGADMVGTSTVPEVIVARHAGMRVLGAAVIAEMCPSDRLEPVEEERRTADEAAAGLSRIVRGAMAAGEGDGDAPAARASGAA